jgi:hypothetical protein
MTEIFKKRVKRSVSGTNWRKRRKEIRFRVKTFINQWIRRGIVVSS